MLIIDVSNTDLARMLMRVIWQIYDTGGISMGRSREAVLLESAMSLIPLSGDCKNFVVKTAIDEASRRVYLGKMEDLSIRIRADILAFSKQPLFDFGPSGLSDIELALFILMELKKEILDEDSEVVLRGFYIASLLSTAVILIFSESRTFFEKSFSVEEALAEVKNRQFQKS
jgi:hypothetical protein